MRAARILILDACFSVFYHALPFTLHDVPFLLSQELQQRIEAAAALCRAATAGAAAAAALSPTAWDRTFSDASLSRPSLGASPHAGLLPAAAEPAVPAGPESLQSATAEETAPAPAAAGPPTEGETEEGPLGLLQPLGSPPPSSEAQLESLKAQIERLRENLGAFTEGVLHAHKRKQRVEHLGIRKDGRGPWPCLSLRNMPRHV